VARRLAAPGRSRFEAAHGGSGACESVGRGQPDNPGADDGDLGSTLHRWR
jgi:hypothetical protein